MLHPEDFFDLSGLECRELFRGVEHVWDVIKKRDGYIQKVLEPRLLGKISRKAIIEGDVFVGKGSVVEPGAMIVGPTIIGENNLIRHGAYIRGNVIIGNNCIVGHPCEVKGSIILNNTELSHFNYVGDSIIGSNVLLAAGVKIANIKLNGCPIEIDINGKIYNTRFIKFGAVIGDEVRVGCNCSLNPGTLIGNKTFIYPNFSLRGYYPANSIIKLKQNQQRCHKNKSPKLSVNAE